MVFEAELQQRLEGEPVEHAQRFFPGDRQLRPGGWRRWVRRARGQSRLDDALPSFAVAVLAVTPSRVAVFETSTRSGAWELTDVFAIWHRDQLTATAQRVELDSTSYHEGMSQSTQTHSVKVVRLELQTPDGLLIADLPTGDRDTTDLAHALGAKVAPARD